MSALVPLNKVCVCVCERLDSKVGVLSLSAELSSSFLALSPLFPFSGSLSAELLFSFLAHPPCPHADDDDCDDHTKTGQLRGSSSPLSLTPFRRLGGGLQARQ